MKLTMTIKVDLPNEPHRGHINKHEILEAAMADVEVFIMETWFNIDRPEAGDATVTGQVEES